MLIRHEYNLKLNINYTSYFLYPQTLTKEQMVDYNLQLSISTTSTLKYFTVSEMLTTIKWIAIHQLTALLRLLHILTFL